MSVTIEKPAATAAQRAVEATEQLREIFGFENLKAMSTAVAEAAAIEAQGNLAFAQRVRALYQDLLKSPKRASTGSHQRASTKPRSRVTPIARVEGYEFDPLAPLDPYFYFKIYGAEQFPLVLEEQTLATLKVAAQKLMTDHPGTKPKTMTKKADVIAYIIEIVTGGH